MYLNLESSFLVVYFFVFTHIFTEYFIQCPISPELPHARRFGDGVVVGTTIMYMCNEGYWFRDHRLLTFVACLQTGMWDKVISDCIGLYTYPHLDCKKFAFIGAKFETIGIFLYLSA